MFKKTLAISALAFSFLSAYAGGPEIPPPPSCLDGFYAGAGGGLVSGVFDQRTDLDIDFESGLFVGHYPVRKYNTVVKGTADLFVGYGQSFDIFYAGLEGGGDVSDLHKDTDTVIVENNIGQTIVTQTTRIKTNDFEGFIEGRLGVHLTPMSLLYGRIGAAFNRLKLETVHDVSGYEIGVPYYGEGGSRRKSVTGLRTGGGFEQCLSSNWSVRADYIYTDYGSIRAKEVGVLPNVLRLTDRTKVNVSSHALLVNVVYHLTSF